MLYLLKHRNFDISENKAIAILATEVKIFSFRLFKPLMNDYIPFLSSTLTQLFARYDMTKFIKNKHNEPRTISVALKFFILDQDCVQDFSLI